MLCWRGWIRLTLWGRTEVADGAGCLVGGGEVLAGWGATKAEDEAVEAAKEFGDFAKGGAEGRRERAASSDGAGGAGDEGFVVGDFFTEECGVGWGKAVCRDGRGGSGKLRLEAVEEEAGFREEGCVAETPPAAAREVDLGGFSFAIGVVEVGGEGLAEFVGEVFEFGFFAVFF